MKSKIKTFSENNSFLKRINNLFNNKKKRYLFMLLFILPFIIAIAIFGFITYREAKNLINLATSGDGVNEKYRINSMRYVLRDNPTDIQEQYFFELKDTIESGSYDDSAVASLIAKNYVADFYTWTNKQGQYDIGGMYYVFDGEFENGDHFIDNVYSKARDGFYHNFEKYVSIYGVDDLLEVENVEVTCKKSDVQFSLNEHVDTLQDEEGNWYKRYEEHFFDTYIAKCSWTYKPTKIFDTSKFAKSINLMIIKAGDRFEIVQASEKEINVKKVEILEEESENSETSKNQEN